MFPSLTQMLAPIVNHLQKKLSKWVSLGKQTTPNGRPHTQKQMNNTKQIASWQVLYLIRFTKDFFNLIEPLHTYHDSGFCIFMALLCVDRCVSLFINVFFCVCVDFVSSVYFYFFLILICLFFLCLIFFYSLDTCSFSNK